jgi:hypothetical protein
LINVSEDDDVVTEPKMTRVPDGVWIGPNGVRYTRISAVLMVTKLTTWNIPRANLCLYHNPWAKKPYHSVLTQLHQAIPENGEVHWLDGENANTLFDLPLSWPEGVA